MKSRHRANLLLISSPMQMIDTTSIVDSCRRYPLRRRCVTSRGTLARYFRCGSRLPAGLGLPDATRLGGFRCLALAMMQTAFRSGNARVRWHFHGDLGSQSVPDDQVTSGAAKAHMRPSTRWRIRVARAPTAPLRHRSRAWLYCGRRRLCSRRDQLNCQVEPAQAHPTRVQQAAIHIVLVVRASDVGPC